MKNALVLLSGGQDSTICAFWARARYNRLITLSIDYGQRHSRELAAAQKIAGLVGSAYHITLPIPGVLDGHSPLIQQSDLETYSSYDEMQKVIGDRVELTSVPLRNAMFLIIAANRAALNDCDDIVIGSCKDDEANYPDCRHGFLSHMEDAIRLGLERTGLELQAPLLKNSKAGTIRLALTLPGCYPALAYTHTAYSGEYPPLTQDHATVLRAQGFLEAGVPDPLILRAFWENRMPLPCTSNYDWIYRVPTAEKSFSQWLEAIEREISL